MSLPEDSTSLDEERSGLRHRIGREIARGAGERWSEEAFNDLALAVFRYQVRANSIYGTFVENRGVRPEQIDDWREVAPVPTRAFKDLPLVCESPDPIEAVFRTSGTTHGARTRGEHRVRDLSLYRASLLEIATHFLRPEIDAVREDSSRLRVLAFLPSPEDRPDSSLVYMAGTLMDAWDDGGGGFLAGSDWTLKEDQVADAFQRASRDSVPTFLIGTAFAFVHWLDLAAATGSPPLPPGSLLVETGGYKGRSRSVPRPELYSGLEKAAGVAAGRIVNEYGMTELLSQFYEPVLHGSSEGDVEPDGEKLGLRYHRGPPWVRTRVLDPRDLTPLPPGEPGLLCHMDLANLDSVACVLTEDMGIALEGSAGFRLLGRAEGAEPRGCSLVMEELLGEGEGA